MLQETEVQGRATRAEAAPRRKKRSPVARVRRLIRKLVGVSKAKVPRPSKPPKAPYLPIYGGLPLPLLTTAINYQFISATCCCSKWGRWHPPRFRRR